MMLKLRRTKKLHFSQIKMKSHRLIWDNSLFNKYYSYQPNENDGFTDEGVGNNQLVTQTGENTPKISPLLILPCQRPIFPGFMAATMIKDEKTMEAILANRESGSGYLGLFLRKTLVDVTTTIPELITSANDIHHGGIFVQIQNIVKTPNSLQILLMAHRQIYLNEITSFGPPVIGHVTHWDRPPMEQTSTIKAYTNEIIAAARDLFKISPLAQEHIQQWMARFNFSDPYKVSDFAVSLTTADPQELQRVLETQNVEERMALALELLVKEREMAKIQKQINQQVEEKISKQQREYFLKEQLKSIKHELGQERDDKDELISTYNEKIKVFESLIARDTLKIIKEEIGKLGSLERNSPEFNVTRTYLDWLTSLPWGVTTKDRLEYIAAKAVLDADHYGLEEVKQRILEFIAVGSLRGNMVGKIICLIGPPGVGKTSIAKSIARALDRKFFRFSVGGLTDMAEIKGHRRTYVGAMPGKPIQSLKSTGSSNPLILIDEIDKLGRGYQGDPASALLELLDPNQNYSFLDHYLDVPFDFSNVLFVCTANDESTIPGPLRDRMEIIRLSGYDLPEKIAIASRYLVPKAVEEAGLKDLVGVTVSIKDDTLETLIKNYCRESGVRNLEKHIERIARKIAFGVLREREGTVATAVSGEREKPMPQSDGSNNWLVTPLNLEVFVGKSKYPQTSIYEGKSGAQFPPGVVMGLAWSPMGGSPIFIETAAIPSATGQSGGSSGGVTVVTGNLQTVMRESVNIAYTFARKFVSRNFPENDFFQTHQLHLHAPEGAVEKDGPSAGIAMTTALISIATGQAVRPNLAMTGEVSLTGKVLPVGGIKEKLLAASNSGAKLVILPHNNRSDVEDLPKYVRDSITVHFASEYEEVFHIAFPGEKNVVNRE